MNSNNPNLPIFDRAPEGGYNPPLNFHSRDPYMFEKDTPAVIRACADEAGWDARSILRTLHEIGSIWSPAPGIVSFGHSPDGSC